MENNKENRISYIDIAKGIGILLMIAGHVFYYGIYKKIIFSFHMPLFVIISGMFFKNNKNFKVYLLKIIKRLLIPYIIGVFIVSMGRNLILSENIKILPQIILGYSNLRSFFIEIETVGVLWFIPYLIFIQLLYYCIYIILEKNDFMIGVECIVIMFCGFYLKKHKAYLPWSIDIAACTIILFFAGNMLFKYKLTEKIINNTKTILLCLIIWGFGFNFIDFELVHREYSIIGFIIAFCGSMVILKISYIIDKYFKYIKYFLKWCGKNSIYILIVHYFEFTIFKYTGSIGEIVIKKMLFIIIVTLIITFFKNIIIKLISKMKKVPQID